MIYVCLSHRHILHALGIQKRFQLLPGYPVLASDQVVFQTAVLDEVQSLVIGERKNVSDILRSEHCIHSLPRNFVWQGSPDPPVYGGPEP